MNANSNSNISIIIDYSLFMCAWVGGCYPHQHPILHKSILLKNMKNDKFWNRLCRSVSSVNWGLSSSICWASHQVELYVRLSMLSRISLKTLMFRLRSNFDSSCLKNKLSFISVVVWWNLYWFNLSTHLEFDKVSRKKICKSIENIFKNATNDTTRETTT